MARMRATHVLVLLVTVGSLVRTTRAHAERAPLPDGLVALDSEEGERLFASSKARRDYWRLSESFVAQQDQSYCPVASSVIVLNALGVAAPEVKAWAPYRAFTQDNVFNDRARELGVARGGLQLAQLGQLLETHPVKAAVHYASDESLDDFRRDAAKGLADPGDYIIVNYLRSAIGQEPTGPIAASLAGHVSPLAAYDEASDKFLILDVARYKYPPVWVDAARLWEAMRTVDVDSGKSRGYVVVTVAPGAALAGTVTATGSRLLYIAIGVVLTFFTLGAVAGALVMRRRMLRRRMI
jgi:hypothetical protein